MFVKFCEEKHNLAKGCQTIALGTLQAYSDADPEFLKFDHKEGSFHAHNQGKELNLSDSETNVLSQGGLVGGGVKVVEGGSVNFNQTFPNSYIFCFSENVTPSIEFAEKIDASYDSWYAISHLNKFISKTAGLLISQLTNDDLLLPAHTDLEFLKNISIQVVHKPVTTLDRSQVLQQNGNNEILNIFQNPVEMAFIKEPSHERLSEYRVLFLVLDPFGQLIQVKPKVKVLKMLPDFGVSEIHIK